MKSRYFVVLTVALCVLAFASPSQAQIFGQNLKVFVGYSNLQGEGFRNQNTDLPSGINTDFFRDRTTLHGGNVSVTGAFKGIGLTGDVSFNRNRQNSDGATGRNSIDTDVVYFMAGPSFHYNGTNHIEPFGRILAGGAHTRFDISNTTTLSSGLEATNSFVAKSTSFAMGAGGGLDLRIGDGPYRVRLIQIDYTPVFLRDKSVDVLGASGAIQPVNLDGQRQDNIRFSFGFVF